MIETSNFLGLQFKNSKRPALLARILKKYRLFQTAMNCQYERPKVSRAWTSTDSRLADLQTKQNLHTVPSAIVASPHSS